VKKRTWLLATVAGLLVVLGIASLAACSGTTSLEALNVNSQQQGIWVTGQGKVTAAPDVAILSLGIQAQAPSVAQAQSDAAAAMNKVMNALTSNGVASKDIKTQYFNITQLTRWDDKNQQQVIIGYQVTNTVTAKIRTLDKTGAIIDAVAQAGGDLTRINSISFTIDDPTTYASQARDKAMADAKAKGEQMARLGGVTLGKPTYISESSYLPTPVPVRLGEGTTTPADQTPISPGEMDVIINVQVAYAIK
jgi:uncharacterized protein YggE